MLKSNNPGAVGSPIAQFEKPAPKNTQNFFPGGVQSLMVVVKSCFKVTASPQTPSPTPPASTAHIAGPPQQLRDRTHSLAQIANRHAGLSRAARLEEDYFINSL